MKKLLYPIIITIISLIGCGNTEQASKDEPAKSVEQLQEEAEQFIEQKDYKNAITKYEEILTASNDSQYKSKIDELKNTEKDIEIVNMTIGELKDALKNPDSLQINEVIIYRSTDDWASVYMDYSAMNGFGGYNRDYAYAAFNKQKPESFFAEYESNYRSAKEDVDIEEETYYFDLTLIDTGK